MSELFRFPGESRASWWNRQLKAKGRHDVEWYVTSSGSMKLRSVDIKQQSLDLEERKASQ